MVVHEVGHVAVVAALDNIVTVPMSAIGRTIGFLQPDRERTLARTFVLALDLDLPILGD